jgi:hypothetical protein
MYTNFLSNQTKASIMQHSNSTTGIQRHFKGGGNQDALQKLPNYSYDECAVCKHCCMLQRESQNYG